MSKLGEHPRLPVLPPPLPEPVDWWERFNPPYPYEVMAPVWLPAGLTLDVLENQDDDSLYYEQRAARAEMRAVLRALGSSRSCTPRQYYRRQLAGWRKKQPCRAYGELHCQRFSGYTEIDPVWHPVADLVHVPELIVLELHQDEQQGRIVRCDSHDTLYHTATWHQCVHLFLKYARN